MPSRLPKEPTDHLVMVIHGVGDPAPGETLSLFARSVAAADQPLSERQDVVWLDEKSSDPNHVQRFATHIRKLEIGGQRATLAEVFWGDLSRVRGGFVGAAFGLLEILFGLQYVAYAAARQKGLVVSAMRWLGLVAAGILHGPVLAVTFCLALLTLTLSGSEMVWPESWRGVLWTQVLICVVCGIAISAASLGTRVTRHEGALQFWHWVNITAMFISGLMIVKFFWLNSLVPEMVVTSEIRPGLIWYCRVLVWMLALLWLAEMFVVLALAATWIAGLYRPAAGRRALHTAFLIPTMIIGFWGLILPLLWVTAAESMRRFLHLDDYNLLFEQAAPMLGVQVIMAGVMGVISVFVVLRYASWRSSIFWLKSGMDRGGDPPRLIVHQGLKFAAGVCATIGVALIAILSVQQVRGVRYEEFAAGRMLFEANHYAVGILVPMIAPVCLLMFTLFPRVRPVLDIVLDVINHFHFRRTTIEDTIDNDEFDIRETTFENGTKYFARRDAIHARIKNALAFFRDHTEGRPTLTLISHSQGTMIAIEVLNDPELAWLSSNFSQIRLVTMGSPFTHLYQFYFSHLYPPLDTEHWQEFRGRVKRWINICRRDDFVGTRIDFPTSTMVPGLEYSNHSVGARGHMNYWSDVEVLDILQRELLDDGSASWRRMKQRRAA